MQLETCEAIAANLSGRLKRLIDANHLLADEESLSDLFPRLLDLAREVTDSESASLMLYHPEDNVLRFAAVRNEAGDDEMAVILRETVALKLGEGIAGWVGQNRKPVIVQDAMKDARFFKQADKKTGFVTRTLLCVPLTHNEELLGVLTALNSKTKPFFEAEDQDILESFADLAAVALIRSRLLEDRVKQERLNTQLQAASKIQTLFWPDLPEPEYGSHIWGLSIPALFVGGDLYDVIPMRDGSWLFYVADVSDKGLPAAMIMAALSMTIRSKAMMFDDVDKMLISINNAMYELMSEEGFFATMVMGKYWPDTGRTQFTLAGHPPPLWTAGKTQRELPVVKGVSLGLRAGAPYQKREIVIDPGDSLLIVTDGVTEAENPVKELFGNDNMWEQIQNSSGPPWGQGILDAVTEWREGTDANDDLTMLEIWREPGS